MPRCYQALEELAELQFERSLYDLSASYLTNALETLNVSYQCCMCIQILMYLVIFKDR